MAPSDGLPKTVTLHGQELSLIAVKMWGYRGGGCYCGMAILTDVAIKLSASTSRIPLPVLLALLISDQT